MANPALSGNAHFSLNPQYHKGEFVPRGKAKLTFAVAGFNFDSQALDVLVVTESKGQLRGSGTVNGTGNFGFILTIVDGKLPGGGGVDKFRIKIFDKSAGNAVVYDNVPGAPDDVDVANPQPIASGSVVIHKEE